MPYVDLEFYQTTYYGEPISPEDWGKYEARAQDAIDALTRYRVEQAGITSYPARLQTLIKKALCSQVEYYVLNGIDTATQGLSGSDFTVGKVSVRSGGSGVESGRYATIAPAAIAYLEQTGLLGPQVGTLDPVGVLGWW